MADYIGIGLAYLFAGVSIYIATLFFMLDFCIKKLPTAEHIIEKILYIVSILALAFGIFILAWSFISMGSILTQYGKQMEEQNQKIVINMSCSDKNNCTANIPNNLVISCPPQDCPSPTICQNQTIFVSEMPSPLKKWCPPMLSFPKFSTNL
ncbi:MAG: hypothetical protein M0Q91_17205 [Methanoregula sp.]|jgi:uncharacterized membrane protein|nr:hypothetical protein [Methanoregula sp.]